MIEEIVATIMAAQAKLPPLTKRRSDLETKRLELVNQLGDESAIDAMDGNAIERNAAGTRQLSAVSSAISDLDQQVTEAETAVRGEMGKVWNETVRPALEREHPTVEDYVVRQVRPLTHTHDEALAISRLLPVLGDFELFGGGEWIARLPLDVAVERMLGILATLADGQLPWNFESRL